ncbi:MAG: potassium-transporting ATPase potassium-binding subunit [Solirubrobacteraceae bacterium]|nr:kdpA [Solirubrobacterales bacterium]MEA2215300.1 potassium-transporting ATPase potassium-binding subunit [Solirubrobacteraceae bacterium]
MTFAGWLTIVLFVGMLSALAFPLGTYMAKVYSGERVFLTPVFGWPERFIYKLLRVDSRREQDWKAYARSLLIFSLAGWLLLYLVLRTQDAFFVPHSVNPQGFESAPWNVTFNTVSSFVTNTNWQFYSGETTMSYLSQMIGLTVQNWLSAGVGIVVAVALVRGIVSRSGKSLGNFWQDIVRTILYVLAPISIIGAIVLVSQGVIANFSNYLTVHTVTGLTQTIAMGPTASQLSIKMLGTNGGGFFNVNSAHPFENPTGFTNFFEMLLVLIIPAALVFMFGRMTGNRRQGYAIYGTMMLMFLGAVVVAYVAEAHGSPAQHAAGLHTHAIAGSTGGNLEGKEQRFGIAGSALFDVVTTVTSCGAVNSAIESFTGIGGAVPFANLSASEVIFGGVGTGLYSILLYVLLAVFIGGLMVGRTPEWLGKKLEAREIKLAGLGILITPLAALFATALAVATKGGRASISELGKGPQGFSESFYAYLSQANNNGSAFAGYTGFIQPNAGNAGSHGVTFADVLGGLVMLFARYGPILFALAVAGALAGKRITPVGLGTMRTDNPTFAVLLIGVVILVGALTFFPALLLGPVVQGLTGHLY